jgi:GDPmannose 4,6-dehydratase
MSKTALITGIAGQDGAYLTELLLEKGYRIFGMDRQAPEDYIENIEHLKSKIFLRRGNLMDQMSLIDLIEEAQPDEIYNFAAQSFIPLSWKEPVITGDVNALGVTRILEAIRRVKPDVKFYQASSSELFGKPERKPQNESTPFNPGTPYGTAKLYAHSITANYRDKLGLFSCSGILYNHESPRRGKEFVTRKITLSAAKIKLGLLDKLHLGNLDAHRDWGFAKDYVQAMWLMLQQDEPDDYVIATGEEHSVRELVATAFSHLGLDWEKYVVQDPKFFRPVDLNMLVGDSSKARKKLDWKPSVSFDQLVKLMVDSDVKAFEKTL